MKYSQEAKQQVPWSCGCSEPYLRIGRSQMEPRCQGVGSPMVTNVGDSGLGEPFKGFESAKQHGKPLWLGSGMEL